MADPKLEKMIIEATKNLLDQDGLGLDNTNKVENPGSASFQFQYEDINAEFALAIKDSNYFDAMNAAFYKVHSYKYLEDPSFGIAFTSELKSMGIPKDEIQIGMDAIDKVRKKILKKDTNEINKGWSPELDGIIKNTQNPDDNNHKIEPFSGIAPDNTRPEKNKL